MYLHLIPSTQHLHSLLPEYYTIPYLTSPTTRTAQHSTARKVRTDQQFPPSLASLFSNTPIPPIPSHPIPSHPVPPERLKCLKVRIRTSAIRTWTSTRA